MEKMYCSISSKYGTVKVCNVKLKSRDLVTANAIFDLKKVVTAVHFQMRTYYKYSNNEYKPTLINANEDVCAVKEGLYISPLYNFVHAFYGKYSNMFSQKCPFLPGEYYVKDFNLQATELPGIFPHGQFLVNHTVFAQFNDWLFNVSAYFQVTNYGVQDFNLW